MPSDDSIRFCRIEGVSTVTSRGQRKHACAGVAADLAVMLAHGGEAISDLAVLRVQAALFGPVASDPPA
ncbi:hypothetical protein [Asanoa iriomotensis]|uniref:hypothetical protein n=1 Tax=Asanoa iriomotensis TaxID=234613 RepID=UPI001940C7EE|nr:hypothetical protein [Asanoa iriomotensis]